VSFAHPPSQPQLHDRLGFVELDDPVTAGAGFFGQPSLAPSQFPPALARQRSDVSSAPGRHTTEHGEMSAISAMGAAVKQPDQAEENQR